MTRFIEVMNLADKYSNKMEHILDYFKYIIDPIIDDTHHIYLTYGFSSNPSIEISPNKIVGEVDKIDNSLGIVTIEGHLYDNAGGRLVETSIKAFNGFRFVPIGSVMREDDGAFIDYSLICFDLVPLDLTDVDISLELIKDQEEQPKKPEVHTVYEGEYEDICLVGIFSTKEAAETYVSAHEDPNNPTPVYYGGSYTVDEFADEPVNPIRYFTKYYLEESNDDPFSFVVKLTEDPNDICRETRFYDSNTIIEYNKCGAAYYRSPYGSALRKGYGFIITDNKLKPEDVRELIIDRLRAKLNITAPIY